MTIVGEVCSAPNCTNGLRYLSLSLLTLIKYVNSSEISPAYRFLYCSSYESTYGPALLAFCNAECFVGDPKPDSPSCSHVLNTSDKSTEHSPTILGSLESSAHTCTWMDLFRGNLAAAPVELEEASVTTDGVSEDLDGRLRISSVSS